MKSALSLGLRSTAIALSLLGGPLANAKPFATIENLSKAFVAESNSYNRYGKFAEKADKEGLALVARLFRSTALSEIIHARNHAAAIDGLGGKQEKFVLKPVMVGTTKENLETAARDERTGEMAMYAAFVAQAEADGLIAAQTSFRYASDSELQHKKLFQNGLALLGVYNVDYYVDVKSGETLEVRVGEPVPLSKLTDGVYVKVAY